MKPFTPGLCAPLLLATAAACTEPGVPPAPEVPLEVEYAGCQEVSEPGPVCVLPEKRTLKVWVSSQEGARVEIRAGGRRADLPAREVEGGWLYEIPVPEGAQDVEFRLETAQGTGRWSRTVVEPGHENARSASRRALEFSGKDRGRLRALIDARSFSRAHQELADLGSPPEAPEEFKWPVAYFGARLARKEGDYRTALREIEKASAVARRVKNAGDLWYAEHERGLVLLDMGRAKEAARHFAAQSTLPREVDPCEQTRVLNNRAWATLLAREVEEFAEGDPIELLEAARSQLDSEDCSWDDGDRFNNRLNLALAHLQVDHLDSARESLEDARELLDHGSAHERLWWFDLEARLLLKDGDPRRALSAFQLLEDAAVAGASIDGRLRAAEGKARAHEFLGERRAAVAILVDAEALLDDQSLRIPVDEGRETFFSRRQAITSLLVKLWLAEGHVDEALEAARRARARVLRQYELNERLASLDAGRLLEWRHAREEYEAVRAQLDREVNDWRLPADRQNRVQVRLRGVLEEWQGRLDRVLSPSEPATSPTQLAPPREGELLLVYHPLPQGWVGFADGGGQVEAHVFELPPAILDGPQELADRLLTPFRTRIERAQRLRILPYGPLRDVDFHALPFAGDVLMVGRPVIYGLDLATRSPAAPPATPRALVVAPSDDLRGSREEALAVSEALRGKAWAVSELVGEAADPAAVRRELALADLLHFAGHGRFGGLGGWESDLALAGKSRLTLGDLLTLSPAPAWVVLSGCETGRSAAEAPLESLGLAHAFLLAGSRAVVASTRPVKDRETLPFVRDLYRRWKEKDDLAAAFHEAQLAWSRSAPDSDWSSFRIFEP